MSMGIFDFLKVSKEKEAKKINLQEAGKLIDSFYENLSKEANSKLIEIKEDISAEKDIMKDNIKTLEEAELKHKAFPEHIIPMMRDNRKSYVQKVIIFLNEINLPNEIEEILKFCDNYERTLNEFSKNTIRNYQILQQFFGEKVNAVSKNIANIDKLIRQAEKIIKDSRIEKTNELKNKLKEMQEEIKRKKDAEEKISLEKAEQKKIDKNLIRIENKRKENEEGPRHKKLISLIEKKKEAGKEIREIEKEPLHSFSIINDALKKYERISLDSKLIKKYLENPLKTLEEDNGLKIIEIISNMKESLINDKIELKQEKKDKTIQECSRITKNYFESFLRKLNELNKRLNELDLEINKDTIVKEIEALKEELRKEKIKENETKNKIEKMTRELKEIDIDEMKKELELKINKEMDENVKII